MLPVDSPAPDAPMTAAEIEELKRLEKAATAAPWTVICCRADSEYKRKHPRQMVGSDEAMRSVIPWCPVDDQRRSDNALITAARNALPRLLAEVERARALLRDIAASGIEFDDGRLRYMTVQVDRTTWCSIRAYLASARGETEEQAR